MDAQQESMISEHFNVEVPILDPRKPMFYIIRGGDPVSQRELRESLISKYGNLKASDTLNTVSSHPRNDEFIDRVCENALPTENVTQEPLDVDAINNFLEKCPHTHIKTLTIDEIYHNNKEFQTALKKEHTEVDWDQVFEKSFEQKFEEFSKKVFKKCPHQQNISQ